MYSCIPKRCRSSWLPTPKNGFDFHSHAPPLGSDDVVEVDDEEDEEDDDDDVVPNTNSESRINQYNKWMTGGEVSCNVQMAGNPNDGLLHCRFNSSALTVPAAPVDRLPW